MARRPLDAFSQLEANPHAPHPTLLFGGADLLQQTATLLLGRGPFAWLGYNFAGRMPQDNMAPCPAVLDADVGVPTGNCSESSAGVFARRFSRGLARLDCNKYTASIPGFHPTDSHSAGVGSSTKTEHQMAGPSDLPGGRETPC